MQVQRYIMLKSRFFSFKTYVMDSFMVFIGDASRTILWYWSEGPNIGSWFFLSNVQFTLFSHVCVRSSVEMHASYIVKHMTPLAWYHEGTAGRLLFRSEIPLMSIKIRRMTSGDGNTWKSALYRHRCHRVAGQASKSQNPIGPWIDFTALRFFIFS